MKKYETSLPSPTPLDTTKLLDVSGVNSPVSVVKEGVLHSASDVSAPPPTLIRSAPPTSRFRPPPYPDPVGSSNLTPSRSPGDTARNTRRRKCIMI